MSPNAIPTPTTTRQLQDELRKNLEQLRTLKDEIRLEAHLANMEVRQRWDQELEPMLAAAEAAVHRATGSAREQVNTTLAAWRSFYELLARRG